MQVGFIGTGLMGRPMAERLLGAGHKVCAWNRTQEKAEPLSGRGARVARSAEEVFEFGEATVLMLADGRAVAQVLDTAASLEGKAILQMSTISPEESVGFAAAVAEQGGEYLEAPVLGSTPQAAEGKLIVMAGGPEAVFARWVDLLHVFGPLHYIGEVGQASALKLALNQLIGSLIVAFSYSLGLVQRSGVEVAHFMDILRQSALFAPSFERKLPRILTGEFEDPNFPVKLLHKDMGLVVAEGRKLGLDTAAVEAVMALFAKARERGLDDLDYSAVARVVVGE